MGVCQSKGSEVISVKKAPENWQQIGNHKPLSRDRLSIWKVTTDEMRGGKHDVPDNHLEVYKNKGNGEFMSQRSMGSMHKDPILEENREQGTLIVMNAKVTIEGASASHYQNSFEEKKIKVTGDRIASNYLETMGIAVTCKKGLKPESPNQDDYSILIDGPSYMMGVFDGHGSHGHSVSSYIHSFLPKLISNHPKFTTDPASIFGECFEKCQNSLEMHCEHPDTEFDCALSGTTASLVLVRADKIYTAHVGDSRVVLSKLKADGSREAVSLTEDHKPNLPDERRRIEALNGHVIKLHDEMSYRVFVNGKDYPGLAMSRAIGDIMSKEIGVISEPAISERTLTSEDEFVLACSDGIWEFISNQEAVDMVASYGRSRVSMAAAHLAKRAWSEWLKQEGDVVDDITVMIAYFNPCTMEAPQASSDAGVTGEPGA